MLLSFFLLVREGGCLAVFWLRLLQEVRALAAGLVAVRAHPPPGPRELQLRSDLLGSRVTGQLPGTFFLNTKVQVLAGTSFE